MTNTPVNLGLIGAGPWGRNYIKTIAGLDGARLTRLASRNPKSTSLVGPDCQINKDWRDLLAAGDLDGIIIATPPAHHADMTLAAIDAGLAVLVEKPMTFSVAEAQAVLSAATSKGAILRVNHIHLYSAAWEGLKREALALGPLSAISTAAGKWGPFNQEAPVLWEWGSHDVAMCIDLLGCPPENVTARLIESRETEEGQGEALALGLDFGSVTAAATLSNLLPDKTRLFTAVFEGGELVYDDTSEEKLCRKIATDDPGVSIPLDDGTPLERAVLAFADAIRRDDSDLTDVRLGLNVVRVLEELSRQTS